MGIIIDRIAFENYRQYGTGALSFKKNDSMLSVMIARNGTGKNDRRKTRRGARRIP